MIAIAIARQGNAMSQLSSVRRIKKIGAHIGAKSYLEIGVFEGKTFHSLRFPRKVAVDPKFQFDVATNKHAGADYFEMPADRYFTAFAGREKFDLIFLDGLHTFRQTFRDFCNSLTCAHDGTVWLIDDVRPSDEHCAMPTHRQAVRSRTEAGLPGKGGWCGDVYKVVFAIHDFFPRLTYVTLGLPGRPQTLLWNYPRRSFRPLFESMEKIEKLTWSEMAERDAIFNAKSEDEGYAFFCETYGNTGTEEVIAPPPAEIRARKISGVARLWSRIAQRVAR